MRRLLVLSLSIAVPVIPGGSAVVATSSAASRAAREVICPLASRSAGCCGPPIAPTPSASRALPVDCCHPTPGVPFCCPPNADCAFPLTIDAAPGPSVAGRRLVITGTRGGVAVGTPVVLWRELPGQRAFHREVQATIGAAGLYTIVRGPRSVETNRHWYVTSEGLRSLTISQRVFALVTLSASSTSAPSGHIVTFSGEVTPSHSGQRVLLEHRIAGRWRRIASSRLDGTSHFTAGHVFGQAGKAALRAFLRGDQRNIASYSPVITVTIGG